MARFVLLEEQGLESIPMAAFTREKGKMGNLLPNIAKGARNTPNPPDLRLWRASARACVRWKR